MVKETMTARQIIAIMIIYIFGSSVILGVNTDAHQDSWISLLTAIVISLPMLLIYARIIKLRPGESIYDMAENLLGKVIGKLINVLMTWYAIHLGALVLRDFSEYIEISTLIKTPQLVVMIMIMITTIYIAKSGAGILGKWAVVILPMVILMVVITVLFSINIINLETIFPIGEHGLKNITVSAYKSFSFPFAETVLFLALACFFKKEDSSYKIYVSGLLIGGFILLIVLLRNLTVLGVGMMISSYFPSFTAARVIEIGDFLARIEGTVTINFILAGITKITVCLIAATKGISKLFSIKNYKDLIVPTALLIITLCTILYTNVMELFAFTDIYAIYAIPFQILIPLTIWIVAEIRARKNKISV